MKIDYQKVLISCLAIAIGALAATYLQPLIHGNKEATNVIVTVFSILAGFLIAIIAIIGDPVLLPPGTWQAAELERGKLNRRLSRHKWLFVAYLITLMLVFVSFLFTKTYPALTTYLERAYLFFGAFSFVLSFQLPWVLMKVQSERIDSWIEHRRATDGIKPKKKSEQ